MITLYHDPLSVCCQKIFLTLAELGLPWREKQINLFNSEQHSEDYLAVNPRAQVPALDHDGWIITESSVIGEYLAEIAPSDTLRPRASQQRAEMRYWVYRASRQIHGACGFIVYAVVARPLQLSQPKEAVLAAIAKIPDPEVRRSRLIGFEHGTDCAEFQEALWYHRDLFAEADRTLDGRRWLVGDDYTLADAALFPYLLRLDHMSMAAAFEPFANLHRWYRDCAARASFQTAIAERIPAAFIDLARQAGKAVPDSHTGFNRAQSGFNR